MTIWSFAQLKQTTPLEAPGAEPVKTLAIGDLIGSEDFNGATMLYVVESDRSVAEVVAALASRTIEIKVTPHAFPGRIYGFKHSGAFRPCLRIDI